MQSTAACTRDCWWAAVLASPFQLHVGVSSAEEQISACLFTHECALPEDPNKQYINRNVSNVLKATLSSFCISQQVKSCFYNCSNRKAGTFLDRDLGGFFCLFKFYGDFHTPHYEKICCKNRDFPNGIKNESNGSLVMCVCYKTTRICSKH